MSRCFLFFVCVISIAQDRVVPHVTPTANFVTHILLLNLGEQSEYYAILPYRSSGAFALPLGLAKEGTLQPGEMLEQSVDEFFGVSDVSHFTIQAADSVSASVTYAANDEAASPANVPAQALQSTQWVLFSGNWDQTYDALAVLNMGNNDAEINIDKLDTNGTLVETHQIASSLAPMAKTLYVHSQHFAPGDGYYYRIRSTDVCAVVALRGDGPSTFLWQNLVIPDDVEAAAPDLVVSQVSVNNSSPSPGGSFVVTARVANTGAGDAKTTVLNFYRSENAVITEADSKIGAVAVDLAAGDSISIQRTVNAPSTVGTYWIGACLSSVEGESQTGNNCSAGVQITVSDTESGEDRVEKMRGHWDFTETIGSTEFEDAYHIHTVRYVQDQMTWYFFGTDNFGNEDVAGTYTDNPNEYAMLDLGITFDHFYVFELNGDNISGCYYLAYHDGTFSNCYELVGRRTSAKRRLSQTDALNLHMNRLVAGQEKRGWVPPEHRAQIGKLRQRLQSQQASEE